MNEFVLWRTDFWYQSWIGAFTSLKILPTDYHLVLIFFIAAEEYTAVLGVS